MPEKKREERKDRCAITFGGNNSTGLNMEQNCSEQHFLSLLAVGAFRFLSGGARDVLTGKLFHVPHYRSVFMNVSAPHMPSDGMLRKTA
jgi:hypothetical protein